MQGGIIQIPIAPHYLWLFVSCQSHNSQFPLVCGRSAAGTEGCRQHFLAPKQLFPQALGAANCTTAIELEFYRKLGSQSNALSKMMLRISVDLTEQ